MQEEHRKAIQRNYVSLVERTDLDSMVTALYEKGVFSEQMIEPYRDATKDQRRRKRDLYLDIQRRGPRAFHKLLDALLEAGYWDLVPELDPNNQIQRWRPNRPSPGPQIISQNNVDDSEYVSIRAAKRGGERPKSGIDTPKISPPNPPVPPPNNTFFNNDEPLFQVKKATKFMEEDKQRDIKLYPTRGRPRGVLVVLSYISFDNDIDSYREGVYIDCKNLKYLFSEIGFKVFSYQNLTKEETISTLSSLKDVLVGAESVFIVVSSHGYERLNSSDTDIRCQDGRLISCNDIVDYFSNHRLPDLWMIPKVFIFQMCRGNNNDYSLVPGGEGEGEEEAGAGGDPPEARTDGTPLAPHNPLSPLRSSEPHKQKKPMYSNILIAHSTVPGYVSHRDPQKGSWFIQSVCEVFAERAHDCHVDELFRLVDEHMQRHFHVQISSVDRRGFNRLLYLHPGLYE